MTEKTNGVPSGEYFTLSMAGVTSPLLEYDLSANDVSPVGYYVLLKCKVVAV